MRKNWLLALVVVIAAVGAPAAASAEQATPQAAVALARRDVNRFWSGVLKRQQVAYWPPSVLWYNTAKNPGPVATPCGRIMVDNSGYCPRNETIYIDARFFQRHFRSVGDYALFTIVAHEWGHHIQNLVDGKGPLGGRRLTPKQIELQADCWAGVYTHSAEQRGILEAGDLEEALTITLESGDSPDTSPDDPRAHGTRQERYDAFLSGYLSGDPASC